MYGLSRRRNGISTPPPEPYHYEDALVLSRAAMTDYSSEASEDEIPRGAVDRPTHQPLELSENKSGILWKFAGQGMSLLSLAASEAATLSRNDAYGDVASNAGFARQLYIHALTYLLRGLPGDLTPEEQLSVRSALPTGVVGPLRVELSGQNQVGIQQGAGLAKTGQPSLLHRALASLIIQLFLLFHFVLPYLQVVARTAYQYERSHRISEKVLASGIDTVDSMGKTGSSISLALWSMGLGEVVAWIVEGVAGGIQEGVGQGMLIVGARKSDDAK